MSVVFHPEREMSGGDLGILMVCPDYMPNVGGEAELAFALARALRNRGNRVTVLAPVDPEGAPEDAELGESIVRELDLDRFLPLPSARGWLVWPEAIDFLGDDLEPNAAQLGEYASFEATVTDDSLEEFIGAGTVAATVPAAAPREEALSSLA